jgi:hypothetical protein
MLKYDLRRETGIREDRCQSCWPTVKPAGGRNPCRPSVDNVFLPQPLSSSRVPCPGGYRRAMARRLPHPPRKRHRPDTIERRKRRAIAREA